MNELISTTEVQTMSSREIAELTGKQHHNVIRDIENMLNALNLEQNSFLSFVNDGPNGRGLKVYNLPKEETLILVSGYNVQMRAAIIRRWQELEEQAKQLAAPQQQTQLIPGTPEHFAACYRAYFGEPVLPSLTAQQQHTEPLEISAPQREHFPAPRDMITISEVREKYFNNKDVLMQLIVSFGVRSQLHHYGYTPDLSAPMADGLIYDRRQLLAILAALRATSHLIKHGGKFLANPALPGMRFTFKRVPTLHDGITADDITSAIEVLLLMK